MEHLWTLISVLVGAFLAYIFPKLAERSNRRRNTYDEAIQFLADYRIQVMARPWGATALTRSIPPKVRVAAVVLDRKIADQFSLPAFEAWRGVYSFISDTGFSPERTYDFDQARDKAVDRMRTDLNIVSSVKEAAANRIPKHKHQPPPPVS
jgi:hypothetical protein